MINILKFSKFPLGEVNYFEIVSKNRERKEIENCGTHFVEL